MKTKAFILLVVIISASLFYYGYFDVMLLNSRQKAARTINNIGSTLLTIIKVPVKHEAKYDDDEIRINGNLYDVAKRVLKNDSVYLTLYHDTDEENILTAISNFFKIDDIVFVASCNKTSIKTIHIVYNPQYYFNKNSFLLQEGNFISPCTSGKIDLQSLPFYEILTPPPQLS